MKKFLKTCGILIIILLVVGGGMFFYASTKDGVGSIEKAFNAITGEKIILQLQDIQENGMGILSNSEVSYDINEASVFDNNYEILTGNIEKTLITQESIKELNIEVGGCLLNFEVSEDEKFYFDGTNIGKMQVYMKNNAIYIRAVKQSEIWNEMDKTVINVYLPENYSMEEIDIVLGAGQINIGSLDAKTIDISVGAGKVIADHLSGSEIDIEVGAGDFYVEAMNAKESTVDLDAGKFSGYNITAENIDINCSMGDITLELNDSENNYNFELEAAMGSVTIGDNTYSGLSQEKTIDNGADKKLTIECAMGNVTASFTN